MERTGFLLVKNTAPLFSSVNVEQIESRVQKIVREIEKSHGIMVPTINFKIHTLDITSKPPQKALSKVLHDEAAGLTRFVANVSTLKMTLDEKLSGSELLIYITVGGPSYLNSVLTSKPPMTAQYCVHEDNIPRLLEELILDIRLGSFFRNQPLLSSVIKNQGLNSLFKQKAKFARAALRRSWLSSIQRGATYATLSSLNSLDPDDIKGRAAEAYRCWAEFSETFGASTLEANFSPRSSKEFRKVTGQLPWPKIRSAASKLSSGRYYLVILRRSFSARESPVTRDRIRSIFGNSPKINSFALFGDGTYLSQATVIENLHRNGHVLVAKIKNSSDGIEVED